MCVRWPCVNEGGCPCIEKALELGVEGQRKKEELKSTCMKQVDKEISAGKKHFVNQNELQVLIGLPLG